MAYAYIPESYCLFLSSNIFENHFTLMAQQQDRTMEEKIVFPSTILDDLIFSYKYLVKDLLMYKNNPIPTITKQF